MNDYLIPLENETFEEYRIRTYKMKQAGTCDLKWTEIANMFAEVFGVSKDESKWRKEAKELLVTSIESLTSDNETEREQMQDLIRRYKMERVKLSDERVQNNAYIRQLSREETIIEIAKYTAEQMSGKKFLKEYEPVGEITTDKEAIIQISDWHYGIEIDNFLNKFNTDVCIERINKLLAEAKEYFAHNPVKRIYVGANTWRK